MDRSICIVTSGDPSNDKLDYREVYEPLRRLLEASGAAVRLVNDAEEGISRLQADYLARCEAKLPGNRRYVVFVSAYYCARALELAKLYSPRIRFIVHSVGLAPLDMPTFAFRGMLTSDTLDNIFS